MYKERKSNKYKTKTATEGALRTDQVTVTAHGPVLVSSFCTPEQIDTYMFDSQFGTFAQYKSLYTKKETLIKHAGHEGANVSLALAQGERIVGFGVMDYPESDERWSQLGERTMIEIQAIEVCRSWRGSGVAKMILQALLEHPLVEKMIVYLVGYSWTWDLDGSRKTTQQYRKMLIKLYTNYGFTEMQTNEPNICLKPENIFMARIGKEITDEMKNKFKWLRFGMSPD
ncbi:MAG: GNAT family N-acetyltransferase [Desulfobacteraceae bacterium]|nr:GNAT family N-acetyltransferase [Desulfobacteraceae bacterium]